MNTAAAQRRCVARKGAKGSNSAAPVRPSGSAAFARVGRFFVRRRRARYSEDAKDGAAVGDDAGEPALRCRDGGRADEVEPAELGVREGRRRVPVHQRVGQPQVDEEAAALQRRANVPRDAAPREAQVRQPRR